MRPRAAWTCYAAPERLDCESPLDGYRLVYEVDEAADTVWVMTLIHTARQWPPARDD